MIDVGMIFEDCEATGPSLDKGLAVCLGIARERQLIICSIELAARCWSHGGRKLKDVQHVRPQKGSADMFMISSRLNLTKDILFVPRRLMNTQTCANIIAVRSMT